MPYSHWNAKWSNFLNAKLANCLRSSQMRILLICWLPKCLFHELLKFPNAKLVASRPTHDKLFKCAFVILIYVFGESADSPNAHLRYSNAYLMSGLTRDQFCIWNLGNSRNAYLRSRPIIHCSLACTHRHTRATKNIHTPSSMHPPPFPPTIRICAFDKLDNSKTTMHLGSWPTHKMRIWSVSRLVKLAFGKSDDSWPTREQLYISRVGRFAKCTF